MAFFVAINVETEMVAFARVLSDCARRNNEEGRPRGRGGPLQEREVAFFQEKKKIEKRESARDVVRCTRTYH